MPLLVSLLAGNLVRDEADTLLADEPRRELAGPGVLAAVPPPHAGPTNDVWMAGVGFGPSFHLGGLPTDLEAIAWHVNHGSEP